MEWIHKWAWENSKNLWLTLQTAIWIKTWITISSALNTILLPLTENIYSNISILKNNSEIKQQPKLF